MTETRADPQDAELFDQLRWFVRLRWGAGGIAALGALIDWIWLGWFRNSPQMFWVGVGILGYNVALLLFIRAAGVSPIDRKFTAERLPQA